MIVMEITVTDIDGDDGLVINDEGCDEGEIFLTIQDHTVKVKIDDLRLALRRISAK